MAKKYGEKMHLLFFIHTIRVVQLQANWVGETHFEQSDGSKYYMLMMMTTKSVYTYVCSTFFSSHILREFFWYSLYLRWWNKSTVKKNSKWQKDLVRCFFSREKERIYSLLTIKIHKCTSRTKRIFLIEGEFVSLQKQHKQMHYFCGFFGDKIQWNRT